MGGEKIGNGQVRREEEEVMMFLSTLSYNILFSPSSDALSIWHCGADLHHHAIRSSGAFCYPTGLCDRLPVHPHRAAPPVFWPVRCLSVPPPPPAEPLRLSGAPTDAWPLQTSAPASHRGPLYCSLSGRSGLPSEVFAEHSAHFFSWA